jgi:multiple antibiotic resistance protein
MNSTSVLQFGLTSFVTLLVVIDPFALVPILAGLLGGKSKDERLAIGARSVHIAFGIAFFFLIAGRLILAGLGVSINAFSISGGVLLFLVALPMLFGSRGGMMSANEQKSTDDTDGDIAVFPIAIPIISGPGTLTTLLVLGAASKGSLAKEAALLAALVLVFVITAVIIRNGDALVARIGSSGVRIVTRVLGIILAALAAQFILNGISGFARGLGAV